MIDGDVRPDLLLDRSTTVCHSSCPYCGRRPSSSLSQPSHCASCSMSTGNFIPQAIEIVKKVCMLLAVVVGSSRNCSETTSE